MSHWHWPSQFRWGIFLSVFVLFAAVSSAVSINNATDSSTSIEKSQTRKRPHKNSPVIIGMALFLCILAALFIATLVVIAVRYRNSFTYRCIAQSFSFMFLQSPLSRSTLSQHPEDDTVSPQLETQTEQEQGSAKCSAIHGCPRAPLWHETHVQWSEAQRNTPISQIRVHSSDGASSSHSEPQYHEAVSLQVNPVNAVLPSSSIPD